MNPDTRIRYADKGVLVVGIQHHFYTALLWRILNRIVYVENTVKFRKGTKRIHTASGGRAEGDVCGISA